VTRAMGRGVVTVMSSAFMMSRSSPVIGWLIGRLVLARNKNSIVVT